MNQNGKRLYYFTGTYPYGLGETWKSNELKFLVDYFEEITVIPYAYGGNFDSPKPPIDGIRYEKPLFIQENEPVKTGSLFRLLDKNFFYYLKEFFGKRVYTSRFRLKAWLHASLRIKQLLAHPVIKNVMKHPSTDVVLCFFWGKGSCDFLPFVDRNRFGKIAVRFHRYDLFEDQNNNYIPYRRELLNAAHIAAPSSENGRQHMQSLYPKAKASIIVGRLGVLGEGLAGEGRDGSLHIITCSYAVPVKRLHLVCQALSMLSIPVEWTHVGDGPLMNDIKEMASRFPANIRSNFPGMIKSEDVLTFYRQRPVDLFINVSSSEGVPFSIMEALSAGIPVFATRVGGTGEIIDDSVGKILDADITGAELAGAIQKYYELDPDEKSRRRKNAHERYLHQCDAEKLTRQFAQLLLT